MGYFQLNTAARLVVAWVVMAGAAQAQGNGNIRDFAAQGFQEFNSFTVPLLHEAFTGEPVQVRAWLDHARDVRFKETTQKAIHTLRSNNSNEFETRNAMAVLDPIKEQVEDQLRSGKNLLLSIDATLQPYDFARGGFPTQFSLPTKNPKNRDSFYCAGANGSLKKPTPAYTTACVQATNLTSDDPLFGFYPVADEARAQMIRERFNQRQLGFLAAVEADGKYRPLKDASMRFGSYFNPFVANGVLPVRIVTLMAYDRQSGEILDIGQAQPPKGPAASQAPAKPAPAAAPAPSPKAQAAPAAPAAPATGDVLFQFDEPGSNPPNAPGAAPPAADPADPVHYGPPDSASARRLSQLLSLLAYTVYSSPERIAEAQRNVAQSSQESARIAADAGRIQIIQSRELKDLEKQLASREKRLQQLLDMQQLKLAAQARFGARLVEGITYKDIYYERFSLADGRTLVVYRGTSNLKDAKTDLELVLSPQSIAEINQNSKSRVVRYGVTGLGAYAKDGKPANFQDAVDTVDRLLRQGVRPERLLLTGHSLGGGYAQYAGYKRQVGEIVTFNPTPLSEALRQELHSSLQGFKGAHANFIAYLPPAAPDGSGQGTLDPVSQKLANYRSVVPDVGGLQVLGPQYVIEICDTKGSAEHRQFQQTLQQLITTGTVAVAGMGKMGAKASAVGAAGAVSGGAASTDAGSAAKKGATTMAKTANVANAGLNCWKHPLLCGGVAAAGGVASAVAGAQGDKAWDSYSAHKMQNLFEALQDEAASNCSAKKLALR